MTTDLKILQTPDTAREPLLDLIRGLALLIISTDHVIGNPLRLVTPASLGYSDMAEVFVFVSGYVNGIRSRHAPSAGSLLRKSGKCVRRALLLYAAILALSASTVAILAGAAAIGIQPFSVSMFLLPPASPPDLIAMITLQTLPFTASVLGLYLVLIWLVPLGRAIYHRPTLAILGSSVLYASVQFRPDVVALPVPWRDSIFFNPFAWQLLFVLGLACGASGSIWRDPARRNVTVGIAVAIGLGLILARFLAGPPSMGLINKVHLGPLRLLHFAIAALLVPAVAPRLWTVQARQILDPLVQCGRHPLFVYVCGGITAVLGTVLLAELQYTLTAVILVNLTGWLVCLVSPLVLVSIQGRGSDRSAEPTASPTPRV